MKKALLLISTFLYIPAAVAIYLIFETQLKGIDNIDYIVAGVFIIISITAIVLGYIISRKSIKLFKHRMFYIIGLAFCNAFLIYYALTSQLSLF